MVAKKKEKVIDEKARLNIIKNQFNDVANQVAYQFYLLKYLINNNANKKLITLLFKDLEQYCDITATSRISGYLTGYSRFALIEYTLRNNNVILYAKNDYDVVVDKELAGLSNSIYKLATHPKTMADGISVFTNVLNGKTIESLTFTSLETEFGKLAFGHYHDVKSAMILFSHPNRKIKAGAGYKNKAIQELLTFLVSMQDSTNSELSGFAFLDKIQKEFFGHAEDLEGANAKAALNRFLDYLCALYEQLYYAPLQNEHYDEASKLSLLEHFKRLINHFSEQYNLEHRIAKVKASETDTLRASIEQMQNKLTELNDHYVFQPDQNDDAITQLKRKEKTFAKRIDTAMLNQVIEKQIELLLAELAGFKQVHQSESQLLEALYTDELNKIQKQTDPHTRLNELKILHSNVYAEIKLLIETEGWKDLITLTNRLLKIYPAVAENQFTRKEQYNDKFRKLCALQETEKNKQALKRLALSIASRIKTKHDTARPMQLTTLTPAGRTFTFKKVKREKPDANKTLRQQRKAQVKRNKKPFEYTLALFQALIGLGGLIELLVPIFPIPVILVAGLIGFGFSYISNQQLVKNSLYRMLVSAFVDNNLFKADSTAAKVKQATILTLCLTTGLVMAMVALIFTLNLPVLFPFISANTAMILGLFNIIPTTLGFGSLMFLTFNKAISSVTGLFNQLSLSNLRYQWSSLTDRYNKASTEEKARLVLNILLFPTTILLAATLTVFTTVAMIAAWYAKISAFLTITAGLSPVIATAISVLTVGITAGIVRSVFNLKNLSAFCFMATDLFVNYALIKPIALPIRAFHFIKNNRDAIIPYLRFKLTNTYTRVTKGLKYIWNNPKEAFPHAWHYAVNKAKYIFKFALLYDAVAANGFMTGSAAKAGGPAYERLFGFPDSLAPWASVTAGTTLSVSVNFKSVTDLKNKGIKPSLTLPTSEVSVNNKTSIAKLPTFFMQPNKDLKKIQIIRQDAQSVNEEDSLQNSDVKEFKIWPSAAIKIS